MRELSRMRPVLKLPPETSKVCCSVGSLAKPNQKVRNRQDDGGESGQDEQEVVELEQLVGDAGLLRVGEDAAKMEHGLGEIVDDEEYQGQAGEAERVGRTDEDQVEDRVLDLLPHLLLLGLLEVKLREDVEPVGYLDDEVKLEQEGHVVMRIALPDRGH